MDSIICVLPDDEEPDDFWLAMVAQGVRDQASLGVHYFELLPKQPNCYELNGDKEYIIPIGSVVCKADLTRRKNSVNIYTISAKEKDRLQRAVDTFNSGNTEFTIRMALMYNRGILIKRGRQCREWYTLAYCSTIPKQY